MLDLTVRHQGTNIELGINMNRKATNEKINCILDTDELLDDSHMPVLMVMNMVKEKRFLAVLEALSKGNSAPSSSSPFALSKSSKSSGNVQAP